MARSAIRRSTPCSGQRIRHGGGQRAERGAEGARQAVARKQPGAGVAFRRQRQPRMLQRQKNADIARSSD